MGGGCYLAPDRGALKAYRLLARSMEEAQRAEIATFVMRDTEHLVAILAEDGLLRAQARRFRDELRTPEDTGLPDVGDDAFAGAPDTESIDLMAALERSLAQDGEALVAALRERG